MPGNTKEGSITLLLTSYLTGLDLSVMQIKTKIVSCHTADSKPVKPEVNSTVILPLLMRKRAIKLLRLKVHLHWRDFACDFTLSLHI